VEERNDDGHHHCRLSESARNLNRRNMYEFFGSHNIDACFAGRFRLPIAIADSVVRAIDRVEL
jgi:hypothetical protein